MGKRQCCIAGAAAPPRARSAQDLTIVEAASYSAIESLRNGRRVEIRALKADDRPDFLAAVDRTSPRSLYRRFFSVRQDFAEQEVDFFLNVDFVNHVALVAVMEEAGQPVIVGAGRYIVVEPGRAEVAFAVVDAYQGQGIGAALLRHLAVVAREAGLKELVADVLPDNLPMLKVFEKSGLDVRTKRSARVVQVTLRLT
jgi:RimJ/RimL family protein N-acetyltransferase